MAATKNSKSAAMGQASEFFWDVLYSKIHNDGVRFKDIYKCDAFPTIIANPGITLGRLVELNGTVPAASDIVAYHVFLAIETLEASGLISASGEALWPTTRGLGLFSFFSDPAKVDGWLEAETNNARMAGVDMAQFAHNVGIVRKAIEKMISIRNGTLADSARE